MLKNVFITFFFLLISFNAFALNYYNFLYTVEQPESFGEVLQRFVKDNSIINAKTPLVKKTMKNNPKIKQWAFMPVGTVVDLYISDDFMDLEKYKPYWANLLKKIQEKNNEKKQFTYPRGLKGSVFYLSSMGSFSQKAADVAEITFKQNSPFSLGTALTFYPKDSLYSASFSAYASYLVASTNSLTSEKTSIPPEIGGNLYGEYRWQKYNLTLYSGLDYENFSLFNLRALENDRKVYVDGVGATYLTLGVAKSFVLFNKQFFSKFSISRSIISSYSTVAPVPVDGSTGYVDSGKYSGNKFLFFINYKMSDKFYLYSLLKYHSMVGPSDLTIFRVGLGFGYILF